MGAKLKILHITSMYPSPERPAFGVFVKSQVDSLNNYVDIELMILPGLGGIFPYIKSIPQILRKLRNQYDIIHIHFGNVSSMIKLIYRGKTPIVTSYCGDDLQGTQVGAGNYTLKSLIFRKLNIYYSYRDNFSIVKSPLLASQIEKRAKQVHIIPNGVEMEKFKEISKTDALKKIGLKDDGKIIILFPADEKRLSKNFAFIQKVLDRFRKKFEFIVLSFKDGKVNPDQVPYYFYSADLVVFPSLSEGSPNVIKEAMGCNCLIFSSPCGDVPWLLDGVKGSKVLPLEAGEWIQALHEFFSGKVSKKDSNSRQMLLQKGLDRDSVAKKIISLYTLVANNNSEES